MVRCPPDSQLHSPAPAGPASQTNSSRSVNKNLASSVKQTCFEETTHVANKVQNVKDLMHHMSLINDQMLALLAEPNEIVVKGELPKPSVHNVN